MHVHFNPSVMTVTWCWVIHIFRIIISKVAFCGKNKQNFITKHSETYNHSSYLKLKLHYKLYWFSQRVLNENLFIPLRSQKHCIGKFSKMSAVYDFVEFLDILQFQLSQQPRNSGNADYTYMSTIHLTL